MKRIITALLIITTLSLNAQREETILGHLRFSGIWASWNSIMGKVKNENVFFHGGYFGFEFGNDLTIGWGGYKSQNNIHTDDLNYYMKWNGPVLTYAPHSYKAIHPIFSVMIANGRIEPSNASFDRVVVAQPSIGAELNLLRWCHVNFNVGYRMVNGVNLPKYTDSDFSGFHGEAGLKIGINWDKW